MRQADTQRTTWQVVCSRAVEEGVAEARGPGRKCRALMSGEQGLENTKAREGENRAMAEP